jgi:hypothetical protein
MAHGNYVYPYRALDLANLERILLDSASGFASVSEDKFGGNCLQVSCIGKSMLGLLRPSGRV